MEQYLSKEMAAARRDAITAIKDYQKRALQGRDLLSDLRYLLKQGNDIGAFDWFDAAHNYHGLMMELLRLLATPGTLAELPESHRKNAGKMLAALARFFGDLKGSHTAEAALDLHQLENHLPDDPTHLEWLTKYYNNKTEDCRPGTVLVVG